MTDIRAAFEAQAVACAELGSPLTARLCRLAGAHLTAETAVGQRIMNWPKDASWRADAVALRLMGALHALVRAGQAPDLAAAYANPAAYSDPEFWALIEQHLRQDETHVLRYLASAPQTNEVRRSVALAAIGHWLSARYARPLVISELGASAGLNLHWRDWRIETPSGDFGPAEAPITLSPDWRGTAPRIAQPDIREVAGVDLSPPDPRQDREKLLSYIWADQTERLARTEAALSHAAQSGIKVAKGDAIEWLEQRLQTRHEGALHLICHTIAWQYFPDHLQAKGEALLRHYGAKADDQAPLARFAMEADATALPGAAMTLDLWPRGERLSFGRVDFHGRWIDWQPGLTSDPSRV